MSLKITSVKYSAREFVRAIPAVVAIVAVLLFLIVSVNRWFNPPDSPPPPSLGTSKGNDRIDKRFTSEPHVDVNPSFPQQSDPIIAFILLQEGGFNPNDPSYEGVYQPTYDWFLEVKQIADAPRYVRDLQDRIDIVHRFYEWYLYDLNSGVSVSPDWFQLMLSDFWVTSMSAALRPLQRWAGVEVDGVWGPHTEAAVMLMFDTLEDKPKFARWYTDQRKAFYRSHGYGESHGLIARADIVEAHTLMQLHIDEIHHRSMEEVDMRQHAPLKALSLEERLERIEKLLSTQK